MGKLFFELNSIDLECSDREYFSLLIKFYQSQEESKIYNDILNFDIDLLTPNQLSIFINMAKRKFIHGKNKKDISKLIKYDNYVYSLESMSLGELILN